MCVCVRARSQILEMFIFLQLFSAAVYLNWNPATYSLSQYNGYVTRLSFDNVSVSLLIQFPDSGDWQ